MARIKHNRLMCSIALQPRDCFTRLLRRVNIRNTTGVRRVNDGTFARHLLTDERHELHDRRDTGSTLELPEVVVAEAHRFNSALSCGDVRIPIVTRPFAFQRGYGVFVFSFGCLSLRRYHLIRERVPLIGGGLGLRGVCAKAVEQPLRKLLELRLYLDAFAKREFVLLGLLRCAERAVYFSECFGVTGSGHRNDVCCAAL